MSHSRIRRLFTNALLEYADTTGITVELDNVDEETAKPSEYIIAHLIPADTFSDTLSGDHKAFIGMFQLTIFTPYGIGSLRAETIIEDIQNIFVINRMFTDVNGFSVQVTSPVKTPEGRQQDIQWKQYAYFDYRADTN